jgi:hypothetical protein
MRIKLTIVVALIICLLMLGSSVDAQQRLKRGGSNNTVGEIRPINEQGTSGQVGAAGQAGTASQTGPTVINFEDLVTGEWGTGGPISVIDQYSAQGITFNNARAIDYSKGIPIPGFAHSGSIAIEACYAAEFCSAPIEMKFNQLQSNVKVWVGVDSKSAGNQKFDVTLRAFDASGQQIAQDTKTLDATQGPVPIQTSLQVSSSDARQKVILRSTIARATVSFSSPSDAYDNGLAVDDVEFENLGIVVPVVGPARQA